MLGIQVHGCELVTFLGCRLARGLERLHPTSEKAWPWERSCLALQAHCLGL